MINHASPLKYDKHISISLKSGDYALIVTRQGEIRLVTAGFESSDPDTYLPRLALGLIVLANKMLEDDWIDEMIKEYFSDPSGMDDVSET